MRSKINKQRRHYEDSGFIQKKVQVTWVLKICPVDCDVLVGKLHRWTMQNKDHKLWYSFVFIYIFWPLSRLILTRTKITGLKLENIP